MERGGNVSGMARQATATLPLKPETKQLIDERKPDGVTYDYWLRSQALNLKQSRRE